jgi:Asp-tRNA(Asn)/Glu-tRNA(Gln) amidotransferase A subunit family amidase
MKPFHTAVASFVDGSHTPRAFLESCIETIEALEPEVGAFVTLQIDRAREAADLATLRYKEGKPLSPIDGMPVGIKDIIETDDMPTEMGSSLFTGYRSMFDAASVSALREAGAVVVGKTVTTEFASFHPRGTKNPWDTTRTPGGSSSGSAAAVGGGMLPGALGTQVVGSILRPAGFCGAIGFKPSVGAINRGGSMDLLSQSCTGVLTASLEDAWLMAMAIASRVGGDPGHVPLAGPATPPPPAAPRAIAVLQTPGWSLASDAAKAELDRAIAVLKQHGVKIITRADNADLEALETALPNAEPLMPPASAPRCASATPKWRNSPPRTTSPPSPSAPRCAPCTPASPLLPMPPSPSPPPAPPRSAWVPPATRSSSSPARISAFPPSPSHC